MQRRYQCHHLRRLRLLGVLLFVVLLTGCAAPLTYADAQATATISGCWPDALPTPRALTVTPLGAPTATAIGATAVAGMPTATALPTTTPIPAARHLLVRRRCHGRRRCRLRRPIRRLSRAAGQVAAGAKPRCRCQ